MTEARQSIELQGKRYYRSPLALPRPGVIATYREAKKLDSGHVMQYKNGATRLDHIDRYNPDAGAKYAAAHLCVDAPEVLVACFVLLALVVYVASE